MSCTGPVDWQRWPKLILPRVWRMPLPSSPPCPRLQLSKVVVAAGGAVFWHCSWLVGHVAHVVCVCVCMNVCVLEWERENKRERMWMFCGYLYMCPIGILMKKQSDICLTFVIMKMKIFKQEQCGINYNWWWLILKKLEKKEIELPSLISAFQKPWTTYWFAVPTLMPSEPWSLYIRGKQHPFATVIAVFKCQFRKCLQVFSNVIWEA